MSDGFAEFHRLARDLADIPDEAAPKVKQAVQVTSGKVKDAWNGKLYDEGHAKRTGRAITYDVTATGDGLTSDIGAVTGSGRQAGIVRLLENGSVHNGGHGYGAAALDENEADFEHGLDLALRAAEASSGL